LFNATPIFSILEHLLGEGNVKQAGGGQIALRFPGSLCYPFTPFPLWNKGWHVDGFHSDSNGIEKGEIRNFTCLVGVYLGDSHLPLSGNLCVFPRAHFLMEHYFQQHGFDDAINHGLQGLPSLNIGDAKEIQVKSGDVVLCHYLLPHTIAPNRSGEIRYAVYFRINVRDQSFHPQSMTDMWMDWPGMYVHSDSVKRKALEEMSGKGYKAGYIDEEVRRQTKKQFKQDVEISDLRCKADALYDNKDFLAAKDIFLELIEEMPDDIVLLIKLSVCLTFATDQISDLEKAEEYLRLLIRRWPVGSIGYGMLAQNLSRQGDLAAKGGQTSKNKITKYHKQAIANIKKMLECPITDDKQPDHILHALKSAAHSLLLLNRPQEISDLVEKAKAKYPALSSSLQNVVGPDAVDVESLWLEGHKWIQKSNKTPQDLIEGRNLFQSILSKNKDDYWATLLVGGCFTWEQRAEEGEEFIRKAISMNGNIPNAYALLAQNLLLQGRKQEVGLIVTEMIGKKFKGIESNPDAQEKIVEALEAFRKASGSKDGLFLHVLDKAKTNYPFLKSRLDTLQNSSDCICA